MSGEREGRDTAARDIGPQDTEKREAAMRLFGALSGVDERYLEECGHTRKVIPFYAKYSKIAAAVLVLFVLGAGYVGVSSLNRIAEVKTAQNDAAMSSSAAAAEEYEFAKSAENQADAELQAAQNGAAQLTGETSGVDDLTNGLADEGIGSPESAGEEQEEAKAEAGAVGGSSNVYAYLPTVWPKGAEVERHMVTEGTVADTAGYEDGPKDGVLPRNDAQKQQTRSYLQVKGVYEKTGKTFEVRIMDLGDIMPGADRVGAYYPAEEFDEKCVKDEMKDEEGNFSVLYAESGHYVLVRFIGSGTADEIWRMFESIHP